MRAFSPLGRLCAAGKALAGDEDGSEDEDEEGAAEDADMEEAAGPRSAAEAPPPASGRGGAAGTTASARGGSGHPQWTSLTYGEARVLIAQYLAKQPSKCEVRGGCVHKDPPSCFFIRVPRPISRPES